MAYRGDKTERATPKRRREAREKGQVAKSIDLSPAVVMLFVVLSINYLAPFSYTKTEEMIKYSYSLISKPEVSMSSISSIFIQITWQFLLIVGPVFIISVIAALIANYAQVGMLFTFKPLMPDFSKISPVKGAQRLLSGKAMVELIKSFLKLIIVGYVGFITISSNYPLLASMSDMELREILKIIGMLIYTLGVRVGIVLLLIGILDYLYQRYDFERNLRMTKQEVKDELKQQEGDPLLKARIRQKQRQIAMQRMMQEVPKADVIITNPIHFAIALVYKQEEMKAPKVIAKGQRLVAAKIKKIAEEHKIPIIEDRSLAAWLFKSVEIGMEVPPELYQAVAEILALVYRLDRRSQSINSTAEAVGSV